MVAIEVMHSQGASKYFNLGIKFFYRIGSSWRVVRVKFVISSRTGHVTKLDQAYLSYNENRDSQPLLITKNYEKYTMDKH